MTGPVKRSSYDSPLRAAQARATRRAIVEAAAALFVENGYGATTVDAIAAAAGVSRKTVFTSVGGKSETLKLAIDWAIVGDDEPVPMLERPVAQQAQQDPDARHILTTFARSTCGVAQRVSALLTVLDSAAGVDAELRALAEQLQEQRLVGMRSLATLVAARDALKPGVSTAEAAQVLWLMSEPRNYAALVRRQGWTHERYAGWLGEALVSVLIDPRYRPRRRA